MAEQWLKITLRSDVVVTARWMTLGGHRSLDYLPGSLLLGAAAARALPFAPQTFLSGKIRFGDGLPLCSDGTVGFPVPLCLHKIKEDENGGIANGVTLTPDAWRKMTSEGKQPRQVRDGYITENGDLIRVALAHRMKTAIDRDRMGRAKDAALFGFEGIEAGAVFVAQINADEDAAADLDQIVEHLIGNVRLGRSRSAEYGQVEIGRWPQGQPLVAPAPGLNASNRRLLSVYLASDLALPRDGQPTLRPQASDFHLHEAPFNLPPDTTCDPTHSYMRARKYASWIAFFGLHGMERHVLTRGSVISFAVPADFAKIDLDNLQTRLNSGVGLYRNEGLGRVLLNPSIAYRDQPFREEMPSQSACPTAQSAQQVTTSANQGLLPFLERRRDRADTANKVEFEGRQWAAEFFKLHQRIDRVLRQQGAKAPGKAQWGNIRAIARRSFNTPAALGEELAKYCRGAIAAEGARTAEHRTLRNAAWSEAVRMEDRNVSLYDAVHAKVQSAEARLCPRILYQAASAMQKKLSQDRDR